MRHALLTAAALALLGSTSCETFDRTIVDRRELKTEHYAHELDYIRSRRKAAGERTNTTLPEPTLNNVLGVAFSGGGIRSATFNLGVLQTLERRGVLHEVDYLSAVSGGAYIGSWYVANVLPRSSPQDTRKSNGILASAKDPRLLLLDPDNGAPGWTSADPLEHLQNSSPFLIDGSGIGIPKLFFSWLLRFPFNLVFDVALHWKPARGKFNSHHPFYIYRHRIEKTYLPESEKLPLARLNPDQSEAPYLIINATLGNYAYFRGDDFPRWGESPYWYSSSPFEFTSDYCGAPALGYIPTDGFDKPVGQVTYNEEGFPSSVSLHRRRWWFFTVDPFPVSSAVGASGAALDAGFAAQKWYHLPLELTLRLFNLNTRYETNNYAQSLSAWYWWPFDRILREMVWDRFWPTVQSNSLQITDGGHYDNLGVNALVRRRVPTIVVFDASSDSKYGYASLRQSMKAVAREGFEWKFDGSFPPAEDSGSTEPPAHPVVKGTIRCKGCDGQCNLCKELGCYEATVYYCKSAISPTYRGVPAFVTAYDRFSESFPHTTTIKQWYDWRRFEAFRQLGAWVADQAVDAAFPNARASR